MRQDDTDYLGPEKGTLRIELTLPLHPSVRYTDLIFQRAIDHFFHGGHLCSLRQSAFPLAGP